MSTLDDLQAADLSGFPDLVTLQDDRARLLWVLWAARDACNTPELSPGEASSLLQDAFAIHVPRQRAHAILNREHGKTVVKRRRTGRDVFRILQGGVDVLSAPANAITLVEPSSAFSGIRTAEETLRSLTGEVRICDPYVDRRTLDFLAELSGASAVRLLTVNVQGERPFRRDLSALAQQLGVTVIVKKAAPGLLHDRYILDPATMIYLGTSIKDLGKKQSFVIQLGPGLVPAIQTAFDRIWGQSPALS